MKWKPRKQYDPMAEWTPVFALAPRRCTGCEMKVWLEKPWYKFDEGIGKWLLLCRTCYVCVVLKGEG
jgi:hypothetical protein